MRVLHVLATGQRRGAEVFAADLVAALAGPDVDQQVAVLHGVPPWAVGFAAPTTALGGRPGRLHPGAVWRLRRLLRDWRPDVVQAHGRRPPIVYRRIGSVSWLSSRPRRVLYGRLVRRAARVVAVAESVRRETLAAFRLPEARVVTIPNGADPRRLAPGRGRDAIRAALGIPREAAVVLSLGALTWGRARPGPLKVPPPLWRGR